MNKERSAVNQISAYSRCMHRCPSELIAQAGEEHATSLKNERLSRGKFPDDDRIPSEIFEKQLMITRRQKALKENNKNYQASLEENEKNIALLEHSFNLLKTELDEYTGRNL